MPLSPPPDLLTRPADETARRLALRQLDEVVQARAALEQADDPDALHDFRVALRRLRSCLRSYREQVKPSVGRRLRRRLRRMARTTGASRDLEVQLQWLHRH